MGVEVATREDCAEVVEMFGYEPDSIIMTFVQDPPMTQSQAEQMVIRAHEAEDNPDDGGEEEKNGGKRKQNGDRPATPLHQSYRLLDVCQGLGATGSQLME